MFIYANYNSMPGHLHVFERTKKSFEEKERRRRTPAKEKTSSLLARVKAAITEATKGKRVDSAQKKIQLSDLQT